MHVCSSRINVGYDIVCIDVHVQLLSGYRVTLRTNLHAEACPADLYQPFIFFNNKSSICELRKTFCINEGQIVSNNGTIRTDRQCRCNHARGFTYVTRPRNVCSCIPLVEDCSCFRKKCYKNHTLSPGMYKILTWHQSC